MIVRLARKKHATILDSCVVLTYDGDPGSTFNSITLSNEEFDRLAMIREAVEQDRAMSPPKNTYAPKNKYALKQNVNGHPASFVTEASSYIEAASIFQTLIDQMSDKPEVVLAHNIFDPTNLK